MYFHVFLSTWVAGTLYLVRWPSAVCIYTPFFGLYFKKRLMYLSAFGDEKWLQSCAFVWWKLSGCTIVDSIGQSRNNQTLPTFFRSQRQAEPSSCLAACHLPCILILNNSCMYSRCLQSLSVFSLHVFLSACLSEHCPRTVLCILVDIKWRDPSQYPCML